ncbi:MAG: hypothetical protein Q7V88_09845 [Actinomycetota bacterium]|nr:hypothetical protein [Actinomycetota bacterium]
MNAHDRRPRALAVSFMLLLATSLMVACSDDSSGGGGGAVGTYTHPEEGTIVLSAGGNGVITQEGSDPVPFQWTQSGTNIAFSFGGAGRANAQLSGNTLTFAVGDFSGDEAAVFTRT